LRHTISLLVENKFGVLARIAGLFSCRGYNIESLTVGETEDPTVSRMTIVVDALDERVLEQIIKQLNKLIDVIKVSDLTEEERVERELALIKLNATSSTRSDIIQLVDIFRAKIVDVSQSTITVEITGDKEKVDGFLRIVRPYGIKEIARTGIVSVVRG
jgi:acetolactate synthase-1/3 small subunit